MLERREEDRQADIARGTIVHYARQNVDCLHGGEEIGLGRLKKGVPRSFLHVAISLEPVIGRF